MPLARLLFYALPAIPIAAMTLPLYVIVPTFYSETLGLSLAAVGAALLRRAHHGRRLRSGHRLAVRSLAAALRAPARLLPARLAGRRLSCVMLFWPPEKPGRVYLAFWGAALSMGFTATQLSYTAWGAELAGNYRERSRIAGFREALRWSAR